MFKYIVNVFALLTVSLYSYAKNTEYYKSCIEITKMLSGEQILDFQRAVYLTENAWYDGDLNEEYFNESISLNATLSKAILETGEIFYTERDKEKAAWQCAVFLLMTDTTKVVAGDFIIESYPLQYHHEDFAGEKDWTNMFVSTLIETGKGNCHSMPYLYKMIMDRLGQESYLALAPNHIYIKAHNLKAGWYNIELTCGGFPTDAWLMASGYIHTDAVRNGLYLEELNDKQSVALCLIDLAQGYQRKYGTGDGEFILDCCNTALEHFPHYINAMLLKVEVMTELYKENQDEKLLAELTTLATQIHHLGYRKMPEGMYLNWLNSLSENEANRNANSIIIRQ